MTLPLDKTTLSGTQLLTSHTANTSVIQPDDVDLRLSLDTVVQEASYRPPSQFDFVSLQNIVYARRAECEDYLWPLREDPAYFEETIQRLAEQKARVIRSYEDLPESWTALKSPDYHERS